MGELGEHPRDLHTFPYWVKTLKGNQSETIDNSISRNGFPGCFISVCSSCFQLAAVCLVQLTVLIRLENNLVSWESGDSFRANSADRTPARTERHHTGACDTTPGVPRAEQATPVPLVEVEVGEKIHKEEGSSPETTGPLCRTGPSICTITTLPKQTPEIRSVEGFCSDLFNPFARDAPCYSLTDDEDPEDGKAVDGDPSSDRRRSVWSTFIGTSTTRTDT